MPIPATEAERKAYLEQKRREREAASTPATTPPSIPAFPPAEDTRQARGREGKDYAASTGRPSLATTKAKIERSKAIAAEHPEWTPQQAWAEVEREASLWDVVPRTARTTDTAERLAGERATDPGTQALHRAAGGRLIPVADVASPPTQVERDAVRRKVERDARAASLVDLAWSVTFGAPEPEAVTGEAAEKVDKPWARAARDLAPVVFSAPLSIADSVAHVVGLNIPAVPTVGEAVSAARDLSTVLDDDAAADLVSDLPGVAARTVVKSGLGELVSFTEGGEQFYEDATYNDQFDPLARVVREGKTWDERKAAYDEMMARPYAALPEKGAQKPVDPAVFRRAVERGDLAGTELERRVKAGMSDDALSSAILRLPAAVVERVQPGSVPTPDQVVSLYARRATRQDLTGAKSADALGEIVASGLYDEDEDAAGGLVLRPSRLQRAMALAGVAESMVTQADVKLWPLVSLANPVLALALYGTMKGAGADKELAMLEEARVPFRAGLEKMAATGAYDDTLQAHGFLPGREWAMVDAPDSTWGSRVAADLALPDYQGPGWRDTYRRAGGTSATTEKALGGADIGGSMLIPFEEMVLGPFATVAAGVNRGAKAARLASDGNKVAAFVAGATPGDDVGRVASVLDAGARADIDAGRALFVDTQARADIEQRWRDAGIDPSEAWAQVEAYRQERAARTLDDIAEMVQRAGTPDVQALRKSAPYARVKAELAALPQASPADVDATMAVLEVKAQHAVDGGAAASLEDFFDGVEYQAGGTPAAGAYFQRTDTENAPTFYSALRRAVEGLKQERFSADQLRAFLRNAPGVKAEEIEWTRLDDFLRENPRPTKAETLAWLDENAVVVEERVLGQKPPSLVDTPEMADIRAKIERAQAEQGQLQAQIDEAMTTGRDPELPNLWRRAEQLRIDRESFAQEWDAAVERSPAAETLVPTSYASYTLPGGANYRELLFRLPQDRRASRLAAELDDAILAQEASVELAGTPAERAVEKAELDRLTNERARLIVEGDEDYSPAYTAPHFGDEGQNLLAHVRFNDRVDAEGRRVLFVEEVQSDAGQDYRDAKKAIEHSVETEFDMIVKRMKRDGVIDVVCD